MAWLFQQGEFRSARRVFEFGCGTGRWAHQLLSEHLPVDAEYVGVDISSTMVTLARERLSEFGKQAQIIETNGTPQITYPDDHFDRFLSTYVFDLLTPTDIQMVIQEAHRVLCPGGLMGLAGITYGHTWGSRITMTLWQVVNRIRPSLLGGCRPMKVMTYLDPEQWRIQSQTQIAVRGIASEAVIAQKQG